MAEFQAHAEAVDSVGTEGDDHEGTPAVTYTYSEMTGGANHSRLTALSYPTGYTVRYASLDRFGRMVQKRWWFAEPNRVNRRGGWPPQARGGEGGSVRDSPRRSGATLVGAAAMTALAAAGAAGSRVAQGVGAIAANGFATGWLSSKHHRLVEHAMFLDSVKPPCPRRVDHAKPPAPSPAAARGMARWRQAEPAGYVDGLNYYEGFAGNPSTLLDPAGTQVQVVVAGDKQQAADRVERMADYEKLIDEALRTLDKVPPEAFAAMVKLGQVRWDGTKFEGDKGRFVQRLQREKESRITYFNSGGLPGLRQAVQKAAAANTQPWDQTVVGIEGWPTGEVDINGNIYKQQAAIKEMQSLLKNPNDLVLSCHNNPQSLQEFAVNERFGMEANLNGRRNRDPEKPPTLVPEACTIDFWPLRYRRVLGAATQPATQPR